MKKKRPLDQEIYLMEYLSGTVASSFEKESDQRILCWDFSKDIDEKLKMQIELLLNEIVKLIKNREERRNRYLLPLKCLFCYAEKSGLKDIMKMEKAQEQEYTLMLKREYGNPCSSPKKFILFCRKLLFLESKNINWEANVWFTERLNISSERYSRSNAVESFSFLDIHSYENRQGLQRYLKYLLTVTSLNLGTIRIHHTYIKDRICAMFDSFSKTASRNYYRDLLRAEKRRNRNHQEEPVDYLLELLGHKDTYPSDSFVLYVDGHSCVVESETLYRALTSLSEKQRAVLLLGFWRNCTDGEIAESYPDRPANPLAGLVYCADCGYKMTHCQPSPRKEKVYDADDAYVCSRYRQLTRDCTMHYIKTSVLRNLILSAIREASAFVRSDEKEFLHLVREETDAETRKEVKEQKKRLQKAEKRIAELDGLIKKLYENSICQGCFLPI